jgi:RecA-family ATPase
MRDLGISESGTKEMMLARWYPHCTPNTDAQFVIDRVASAFRNAQNGAGCYACAPASETFAHLTEQIAKLAADAGAKLSEGFTRSGNLSYRSMQDITPEEIAWIWPGRIAAGKLTLIAGAPDDGKTQIVINIASTISNGGSWAFGEGTVEQGAVIWLSAEDTAADITVPRLMAAGANLKLIFELEATVRVDGGVRTFNIVDDLDELTAMIDTIEREYKVPVKAIMIDPISAYMGGRSKGDTWKNSDVRNIMTPLLTFIGKAGVSVIGITHFNKSNDANVLNRVIDSMALPAISRTTLLTATEKDDDGTPTGRRLLLKGKQNISADPCPVSPIGSKRPWCPMAKAAP